MAARGATNRGEGRTPAEGLNDAAKVFFGANARFEPSTHPEYFLAMKCLAVRLGEEFHDREDLEDLLPGGA